MQRELSILKKEPPPGISCWPVDDQIDKLQAGLTLFLSIPCCSLVYSLTFIIDWLKAWHLRKLTFKSQTETLLYSSSSKVEV